MGETVLHDFGRSLAHKLFQHQMHGQLLNTINLQNAASLASARDEIEALLSRQQQLEAENGRLAAENRRLVAEGERCETSLESLRTEASHARERSEALSEVLGALTDSLRRYGFDRRKFRRLIIGIGERTSASGPEAVRHPILLTEARRVLGSR